VIRLPEGAHVEIPDLAWFRVVGVDGLDENYFVRAVADAIEELNGLPTALDRCREAFDQFVRTRPSACTHRVRRCHCRAWCSQQLRNS